MSLPHSWQMTDEEYMEYHESREDLASEEIVEPELEVDTGNCPYCKWEDECLGGCKLPGASCQYKFERKDEQE